MAGCPKAAVGKRYTLSAIKGQQKHIAAGDISVGDEFNALPVQGSPAHSRLPLYLAILEHNVRYFKDIGIDDCDDDEGDDSDDNPEGDDNHEDDDIDALMGAGSGDEKQAKQNLAPEEEQEAFDRLESWTLSEERQRQIYEFNITKWSAFFVLPDILADS
ncbi:hypothetical protein V8C34DRAFT_308856 [Trichoderma compactum]